jgi:hypothetical protein
VRLPAAPGPEGRHAANGVPREPQSLVHRLFGLEVQVGSSTCRRPPTYMWSFVVPSFWGSCEH